jgi:ribosomal protein S18 acetylase RimI-like enzyme
MELRWLGRADLEQLYNLFTLCFDSQTLSKEFFKWKYFDNPAGEALICGLFDGTKLIASGALLPELIDYQGSYKLIYKCTDLMTDPAYRGKGLAKKLVHNLTENGLEKSDFLYTICSKVATKSFLRADWSYIDKMIYFVRFPLFSLLKTNTNIIYHRSSFDEVISSFNLPGSENEVKILKEELLWRIQNPKFHYGMYELVEQGISHFIVFSYLNRSIQLVYFTTYSSKKILRKLFGRLHKDARQTNQKVISLLPANTQYFSFFIKKGYLTNLFSFGKMQSLLDLNFISTQNDAGFISFFKRKLTMLNYDDI